MSIQNAMDFFESVNIVVKYVFDSNNIQNRRFVITEY